MKKSLMTLLAVFAVAALPIASPHAVKAQAGPKPLTTEAIAAWKSLRGTATSNDGAWPPLVVTLPLATATLGACALWVWLRWRNPDANARIAATTTTMRISRTARMG